MTLASQCDRLRAAMHTGSTTIQRVSEASGCPACRNAAIFADESGRTCSKSGRYGGERKQLFTWGPARNLSRTLFFERTIAEGTLLAVVLLKNGAIAALMRGRTCPAEPRISLAWLQHNAFESCQTTAPRYRDGLATYRLNKRYVNGGISNCFRR
jgi:hypothetical protein